MTWRASESQIGGSLTPNLQINIVNAFLTAPNFKDFLGTLTNGPTVVCGHSLGNLLALIALNDHDARMDKLLMIDAAVALEAVDGGTPVNTNMIHSDWLAYSPRLFAANWFRLFPTNDARSALTWSNRLANFRSTQVFNYYSSGEEVLREHTGLTPDFTGYVESTLINVLRGSAPAAAFSWAYQEKLKGRSPFNGILSSTHGGWKFNDWSYGTNTTQNPDVWTHMSPARAALLADVPLRTNAFFDLTSSPTDIWDAILQIPSGNVYAQTQRNRILSDAIPALTLPAGANPVPKLTPLGGPNRNFDLNTQFKNGWPLTRSSVEDQKWHHSDMREVAYTFVYLLFDDLVLKGDLK